MKIINIFGGPGVGKSTISAGLFYEMKRCGINVEYVNEYAKDLVYENRLNVLSQDQLYIFAKQHRKIFRLIGKVDCVITDSPLLLSIIYGRRREREVCSNELLSELVMHVAHGYCNINVLLKRNNIFDYKTEGRLQAEREAIKIDKEIEDLLEKDEDEYISIKNSGNTVAEIITKLDFDLFHRAVSA